MAKPNLIVMTHSRSCSSAIRRHFPEYRRVWASTLSQATREAGVSPYSAAILELPVDGLPDWCVKLAELINNPFRLQVFTIGEAQRMHWDPLLRAAGVSVCAWSHLDFPMLVKAIERHTGSVKPNQCSTMSGILRDLPWPSAATDEPA